MFTGGAASKDTHILCDASVFARDIANERADSMTPKHIHDVALAVARDHGMQVYELVGQQLLDNGLNMLHAVGKAAA